MRIALAVLIAAAVSLVVYWRLKDTYDLWSLRDYYARKRAEKAAPAKK